MLIATMNGIKRKYPETKFTVFSLSRKDWDSDTASKFPEIEILPWSTWTVLIIWFKLYLIPGISILNHRLPIGKELRKSIKRIKSSDLILAASGYAIGSRWSIFHSRRIIRTIKIAKRYKKPIYLVPQSFGPFNWKGKKADKFMKDIYKTLCYPEQIYCREKEGYECLSTLGLKNIKLAPDSVVSDNNFLDGEMFIKESFQNKSLISEKGSIGLVINKHIIDRDDRTSIKNLYVNILKYLIKNTDEKIVVFKSSTEDDKYLNDLCKMFSDEQRIIFDLNDYNSIELVKYIRNFNFLIASRYHSCIFAYLNSVPCVIIGWSEKYYNLAEYFQQEKFVVSIEDWNEIRIFENIDYLSENYKKESKVISSSIIEIQNNSFFNEINIG